MNTLSSVLLIDDDPVSISVNTRALQKAGIDQNNIVTAKNGLDGLRTLVISDTHTDDVAHNLVFLDINMPVMDGFEFLVLFREIQFMNRSNIKIVILTAFPNPLHIEKVKALGVEHYLEKPLTVEKIRELIAA